MNKDSAGRAVTRLRRSPNALLRTFLSGLRMLLYALIVVETVLLAYVVAALA